MAKINKCQLAEVLPNLESIVPLDSCRFALRSSDDLFLCALGFEPRCLTLPDQLQAAGYKARRARYFTYSTNLDDNAVNLPELERHLRGIASSVEPIEADVADSPNRLRSLIELVISESKGLQPRVVLDISVAANRLLIRCLKVLLEYDISLTILYSEAAIYRPTKEEFEKDPGGWGRGDLLGLERGVGDVMPSIDYPGQTLDPLPDSVILFPSFKEERSKAIISFVDQSLLNNPGDKVIWLLGVPHLAEDCWRLEAMKNVNGICQGSRHCEVGTFDYKATLRVLENLYEEIADRYRITISPLGSKMQALGTALFCFMHPDVRIILSMPREYNATHYSVGCKAVWQIDLGSLADLRLKLDMVGTLRIEE